MKISREKLYKYIMLSIGIFCQISPLFSRIIVVAYLGIIGMLLLITKEKPLKIKLEYGLTWYGLFVIYIFLSLGYTINKINTDYVLIRVITYLILCIYATGIVDFKKNINQLIYGFAIGGIIGILIVFYHQHNLIGITRLGGNGLYGSYVEFGNIGMLTVCSLYWITINMSKKKKIPKIIMIIMTLLSFFAVALSGTRKAFFLPIIFILIMVIFDARAKLRKKILMIILALILGIIFLYYCMKNEILYSIIGNRVETLIESILHGSNTDGSLEQRTSFKLLALSMFKERPLIGYGVHSFAYKNYIVNNWLVYSHDGLLEILSCYGIIGFILYYRIYLVILINIKKMYISTKRNKFALFLISYVLITLVTEGYSISFLSQSTIIILGITATYCKRLKKGEFK